MNGERWLPVLGWEGEYSVSTRGRVRSHRRIVQRCNGTRHTVRASILRPYLADGHRPRVRFSCPGYSELRYVTDLMREAFGDEQIQQRKEHYD